MLRNFYKDKYFITACTQLCRKLIFFILSANHPFYVNKLIALKILLCKTPFFFQASSQGFYRRKLRKSAKIFRRINKIAIFAEEKCGNPQKSFVSYGYRKE